MDVVGPALLGAATGQGHRKIAAGLDLPEGTVRDWIRRAGVRAQRLRELGTVTAHDFDPLHPAVASAGSVLADAIGAMGLAASAFVRRFGPVAPPWHILAAVARGQLLAPLRSD